MTFEDMKMRPTLLLPVLLATILAIVPGPRACVAMEVGQPAPSLVVQELDGQTFDLSAARGKVVVVSFWGNLVSPVS